METTICRRLAFSLNHVFNPKPGDNYSLCKGPCSNPCIPMAVLATGPGKGGGLVEKPVIEKSSPGWEFELDLRHLEGWDNWHEDLKFLHTQSQESNTLDICLRVDESFPLNHTPGLIPVF